MKHENFTDAYKVEYSLEAALVIPWFLRNSTFVIRSGYVFASFSNATNEYNTRPTRPKQAQKEQVASGVMPNEFAM